MTRSFAIIILVAVCATAIAAEQSDAYASADLPALSREWFGADYKTVAAAIDSGTIPLPRFSDEAGAKLLKRMTATENLALAQNKNLPIEGRFQEILIIAPAAQSFLRAYLNAVNRGEKVNAELAALIAFQLHLVAAQSRLTDEFLPTAPRDDKYAARLDGLRLIRSAMTNIFLGATTSLSETHFYSADDVSLMLEAMADTLPAARNMLAADFRSELRKKLEALRERMARPVDVKNLDRMLTELKTI